MKRLCALLACGACLLLPARAAAPSDSAAAMILYHAPSATVLAGHDTLAQLPMASTTKIMTALVAAERCDGAQPVLIRREWTLVEGSSMYLREGETLTVEELLCGLLLTSGNDAALALAEHCAGSVEGFVAAMNEKAAALGMTETHFDNPHGLSSAQHYSCARDMAVLMGAAMENESFQRISAMKSCQIGERTLRNHNRLLTDCAGVISGKTGYTRAAGRCLVTCCRREGLELICVTLGDRRDWNDHSTLYDWAYGAYRDFSIACGDVLAQVPVVSGTAEYAQAAAAQSVSLCLPRGESVLLTADLPRFLYAPVYGGDAAGTLRILCGGETLAGIPLRFRESVELLPDTISKEGILP